ncbi:hypothetical protein, partial [Streptomyces exfoliatus]|uniref:hypothetical protein n=1 Tax=Streptomyces exfoliatus TaxID=1905 RepID=UPI000464E099
GAVARGTSVTVTRGTDAATTPGAMGLVGVGAGAGAGAVGVGVADVGLGAAVGVPGAVGRLAIVGAAGT